MVQEGGRGVKNDKVTKKVVLTRHAELKLQERHLRLEWIERTARNPLWVEAEPADISAERRFGRIDEFGGRMLRVVCVETENVIRVITALFDRDARNDR
jgi:Domain of unknown function (DUF4258)